MTRLHRATPAELEVRGDGRTVVGIAVPFGTATTITDATGTYAESFERGAFSRTIAERGDRVKFLAHHNAQALPLGRATELREDPAGLVAAFRVSETVAGDEVLALIRDGALDALSVGFAPVRDRWAADRSTVERLEVKLFEVSAVAFPAYESATILAVRDTTDDADPIYARHLFVDRLTRLRPGGSIQSRSIVDARRAFDTFRK